MDPTAILFTIPIVAILSNAIVKIVEAKARRPNQAADSRIAELEKRLAENEQRVVTLQDIVIGGEYEARQRLERRLLEQRSLEAMQGSTLAQTQGSSAAQMPNPSVLEPPPSQ